MALEGGTVAGIEVALDRQALGQQHLVGGQFHVPVFYMVNGLPGDRGAIAAMLIDGKRDSIDPHLYDAHIATGFENYMLSMKPMAVRFVVRLMGGQTDKNKGISELKITSQQGIYLAPFAQILLAVAELREGNKEQAKAILAELAKQFPENPMYEHQLERIH